MSVESSSLRTSEAKHRLGFGSHSSVAQGDRAEQPGSPSIEEIAAVELPGVIEPRLQKRTLLVDSLIRECKCDLSSDEFFKAVRYAGPLVTVRRPTPEESVFDAPPGYFAIHLKSLESGFRFPIESLVIDFFKYFDFLPCQLVPNSHRYLAGFLIRCREMGVRADLERLLTLFRVAKSSGSDGGSFAALCQRQERLFKTKKESNKTWKSKFVFVSVGSASPFRDAPLSSFRRRSKPFASSKAVADTDMLCSGGPYEPGALVNDEALAKFGFVFHDEDEPKRRVVQSQLEEGPSGEIMISAADRKKLFKSKPRSESSQERPLLPTPTPSTERAQASKKRKDVCSATEGASLSGTRSPPSRSVDCGNPAFVKVAFPPNPSFLHGDYEPRRFLQSFIPPPDRMEICSSATEDLASTLKLEVGSVAMRIPELVERLERYVAEKAKGEGELQRLLEHMAGLEGKLADAEERARASEQARLAAEEKASTRGVFSMGFARGVFPIFSVPAMSHSAPTPPDSSEMRGETLSLSSYSPGGSSAIPTKSGPSSTPPPSTRDLWDTDSESESVHLDTFVKIPGFIYYSSEEEAKTPPWPARREEAVAPPAAPDLRGRRRRLPTPPVDGSGESSAASHHPSRQSNEDPGSPSIGESTGHSFVGRAPSPPSYAPPCACKRGWNCGMH
ncbi:unnamed protein product [Cuscuta campestris]|uniref:Transposase (putative) gypsy type domain-containing protein n=1 Tax=Cuscuta campestris TaxID=132261 RepID=A0A484M6B8_9ASTE|nr:unnamed protein product [Cuscuta campestris]